MALHQPSVSSPLASSLPRIEISPAPHKNKSPSASPSREDHRSSRATYLSPPPRLSPNEIATAKLTAQLKHLPGGVKGQGLEKIRFETLLRASKDRKALLCNTKKAAELRKEVATIVQRNRQAERRARFLAKLDAPPSPTAAELPVTPPESPCIYHFSLPSPGMESPLDIAEDPPSSTHKWIEEVDFHSNNTILHHCPPTPLQQSHKPPPSSRTRTPLPSLEDITSRYVNNNLSFTKQPERPRLPQFLRTASTEKVVRQPPTPTPPVGPVTCHPWKPLRIADKVQARILENNPPTIPLTEENLMAFTYPTRPRFQTSREYHVPPPPQNTPIEAGGGSEARTSRRFSAPPRLVPEDEDKPMIPGGF